MSLDEDAVLSLLWEAFDELTQGEISHSGPARALACVIADTAQMQPYLVRVTDSRGSATQCLMTVVLALDVYDAYARLEKLPLPYFDPEVSVEVVCPGTLLPVKMFDSTGPNE